MSRKTPKGANTNSPAIHGAVQKQRRRPSARAASTPKPASHAGASARRGSHHHRPAPLFAALGDPTRLSLLARLSRGQACSISQLTHGSHLTRQAITKHLRVLEHAKIVRCVRSGRERLYELDPQPVHDLRDYLDRISAEWDKALLRLKSLVEE